MGRKPFFAVASILLAGLAMTGCQQTRADKTLKQPWPPTPQKNTTQGWNRQPTGGTNGLPKTNTNSYPQGSYQGMSPGGGLPTGQSNLNNNLQGMSMPSGQNNVQRVTTPLSSGYPVQNMNNSYPQKQSMGIPQQTSMNLDGNIPGPLPTPTTKINPPVNNYAPTNMAANRNQQIIPGPVPVHGSNGELDLPTPGAAQEMGSSLGRTASSELPVPPTSGTSSAVNFPGGLQPALPTPPAPSGI